MMANYTFGTWDISGRAVQGRGRIILVGMEEDVEWDDIRKMNGAVAYTSPANRSIDGQVNIHINLRAEGNNAFGGNSIINGGTLLHELGHAMQFLGNTGVQIQQDGYFDGDQWVATGQLHTNMQLIRQNCLPGLPDFTPQ